MDQIPPPPLPLPPAPLLLPPPPLLLPLGGGLLLGGGVPDVDGVFGFVGGVDCVGQLALASITDPSGHVFVVGGVDVDGVNDWVHEGSVGFLYNLLVVQFLKCNYLLHMSFLCPFLLLMLELMCCSVGLLRMRY